MVQARTLGREPRRPREGLRFQSQVPTPLSPLPQRTLTSTWSPQVWLKGFWGRRSEMLPCKLVVLLWWDAADLAPRVGTAMPGPRVVAPDVPRPGMCLSLEVGKPWGVRDPICSMASLAGKERVPGSKPSHATGGPELSLAQQSGSSGPKSDTPWLPLLALPPCSCVAWSKALSSLNLTFPNCKIGLLT